MNFSMWGKAMRVIPRVEKDEWAKLDPIAKWLIAARAAVLVMTFTSAMIAGLLAWRDGYFNGWVWLLVVIGLVLSHATNNLVNDLVDYEKGVDRDNYFRAQYGPQTLEHGLLTRNQLLGYIAVTGLLALAIGIALVAYRGGLTIWLLGLGVFFVLLYTWPLKYIGLGEIAVLLVWGPLMIGGGYYVITGNWDWTIILASLPYTLGATTVIFGKHIDKLDGDKAKKIRTLPVLLGEKISRYVAMVMFILMYALVVYLIITGFFTPVMLVIFLAWKPLINCLKMYNQPRPDGPPADYPEGGWPLWFVGAAFLHTRQFGMYFMLGLILDTILKVFILK